MLASFYENLSLLNLLKRRMNNFRSPQSRRPLTDDDGNAGGDDTEQGDAADDELERGPHQEARQGFLLPHNPVEGPVHQGDAEQDERHPEDGAHELLQPAGAAHRKDAVRR